MRQPLPTVAPWADVDGVLAALGLDRAALAAPVEVYDNGPTHLVVAVGDERPSSAPPPTRPLGAAVAGGPARRCAR